MNRTNAREVCPLLWLINRAGEKTRGLRNSNADICNQMGNANTVINRIKMKTLQCFEHVMRLSEKLMASEDSAVSAV